MRLWAGIEYGYACPKVWIAAVTQAVVEKFWRVLPGSRGVAEFWVTHKHLKAPLPLCSYHSESCPWWRGRNRGALPRAYRFGRRSFLDLLQALMCVPDPV